jgi:hypothetical protein
MNSRSAVQSHLFLFLVLLAALGCAPGLGTSLHVSELALPESTIKDPVPNGDIKVRVAAFNDLRANSAIAEVNGRQIPPEGDLGLTVQRAFEQEFKQRGMTLALFQGPPTISGEIIDWKVDVTPSFPLSKVNATATFRLILSDASNQPVYSARYSGESFLRHPYPTESTIQGILGEAMSQAVRQAADDPELLDRLRTLALRDVPVPAPGATNPSTPPNPGSGIVPPQLPATSDNSLLCVNAGQCYWRPAVQG